MRTKQTGTRNLWLAALVVVALVTSGLVLKGSGIQVASDTWASAGPMAEARDSAAAVLLSDGRILVTGGKNAKGKSGKGALASVEFLDAAGVSSSAPSMLEARSGHSATLLWDGRVLVAGGTGSLGGPLASAEIYDPASSSWSLVGNMLEARTGHSATLLEDGRVLLAGGNGLAGPSTALEAFDPGSDSFSLAGVLSQPRRGHASALLAGGRVIIIGGSNVGGVLDSTEIFDPSSGSVSAGPKLSGPRKGHTATNLIGGILVAGGDDGVADLASAELLLGSEWVATGSMSSARSGHIALRLADNYTILIAGGAGGSAVELYNEFSGQFSPASSMASAHAAAVAENTSAPGVALVAGGDGSASVEAYGFATIQTDSKHYKPGDTVTITGSGWLPGETVTIVLHETPYVHEDSVLTAVADSNGDIVNSEFSPEVHDLEAHFLVAASGQNAQAIAYFWDDHVNPIFINETNPNCASLGVGAIEFKVEPVASGSFDDGTLFVTLTVNDTLSGPTFDWTSNGGIDGAIVKGGSNANLYQYDPPQEETEDTGLHAPVNESNNKFFGLSHISFCYDIVPAVEVIKSGDALSKVGDDVTYNFTINNTGDLPLFLDSVIDDVLGDLTSSAIANSCGSLAVGGSCSFTASRTVQAGDDDPLVNTVTVTYNTESDLSGTTVNHSDSHSTNLFQPAVSIVKSGPSSAVVGESISYDFTITNNSSSDSPDLILDSVSDTVLGSLTAAASSNGCSSLASGASCSFSANWTVAASPDPLVNTVTVHYHPDGFPNDISDDDSHSVDVLVASVEIDKTGDALSKVGDAVNYTITVNNTGEVALTCDVTDSLLGTLQSGLQLGVSGSATFTPSRTVESGDPDPLVNTASVSCTVDVAPAVSVNDSDDHSTNLFQPAVSVEKGGPNFAIVGDTITYDFTITNNSSSDSPALILDSVSDTVLGSLTAAASSNGCSSLASGASCSFSANWTVAASPDPLVNTVTVHYHPDGFPNDISDSDDHTVDVIDPSVEIAKTGDDLSKVGDAVNYTITVTNTSSVGTPDLVCQISDSLLGISKSVTLASGAADVTSASRTVQSGDPDPLVNTASVDCSVPNSSITVSDSASHSTNLFQPAVTVDKSGPTSAKIGDLVTYSFTITNTSSADTPVLNLDATNGVVDTVLGNLTSLASSNGCSSLASGGTCSFSVDYTIQADDPDPLVNTVTVLYHPAGFPNNITASDTHSVDIFREGCTPGYWKTHPEQWPAPFVPNMTLGQVFDMTNFPQYANTRLIDALDFPGGNGVDGAARILLRAAVASLLNAASSGVDFTDFSGNPITISDVITSVNAALNSSGSVGQRRKAMIELAAFLDALNNGVCLLGGTSATPNQ